MLQHIVCIISRARMHGNWDAGEDMNGCYSAARRGTICYIESKARRRLRRALGVGKGAFSA